MCERNFYSGSYMKIKHLNFFKGGKTGLEFLPHTRFLLTPNIILPCNFHLIKYQGVKNFDILARIGVIL